MTPVRAMVWLASAAALAGTLHAAVNRRNLRHLSDPPRRRVDVPVSVLVPARDEAANVGAIVTDLIAQEGVADLEILILDDDSSDDTARIAQDSSHGDPRVQVTSARGNPPRGWLGKPHACSRLAQWARGDVLVFLDADVRLAPEAIARAVADLIASESSLVSAWPRQLATTPLARLLQPLQQWSWLTTIPLSVAADSDRDSLAAANGQFLVITRQGYDAIGGHGAVAGEVLEDIALARAVKRAGLRADIVDASPVAACLMYAADRDLVTGYTKSLWAAFGGPTRSVAATGVLAVLFTLPLGYALVGRHAPTRWVGLVGYAAGVAGRVISARSTGGPPWPSAAAHPAAVTALAVLTMRSAHLHRLGRLRWRGRPVDALP